jgi:hypothetical protein
MALGDLSVFDRIKRESSVTVPAMWSWIDLFNGMIISPATPGLMGIGR